MILLICSVPDALSFLSRYLETHVEVPYTRQQISSQFRNFIRCCAAAVKAQSACSVWEDSLKWYCCLLLLINRSPTSYAHAMHKTWVWRADWLTCICSSEEINSVTQATLVTTAMISRVRASAKAGMLTSTLALSLPLVSCNLWNVHSA